MKMYVKGQRITFGTGVSIYPELWDAESMRPTSDRASIAKFRKRDPKIYIKVEGVKDRIHLIDNALTTYYFPLVTPPSPDAVKEHLVSIVRAKELPVKHERVLPYLEMVIKEMEAGTRTTKGHPYAKGSINQYKALKLRITKYKANPTWAEITQSFYDGFTDHLRRKGLKPNTIGKHVKVLKAVMRSAYEEGLHTNLAWQGKRFVTIRKEIEAVYLSQQELDSLANLDLSKEPRNERVRDLFLIGCHTAQRFSDYSRICPQFIKTKDGKKYLDLIQKKTKQRVVFPIRPALERLLKKYEYSAPFDYEQKVNLRIKTIAKRADIDALVQTTVYEGTTEVQKSVPKHELITTHTCRRTGATLMHLAGISAVDICKVTGHTTVTALMRYLRITEEEAAEKLSDHPYFS